MELTPKQREALQTIADNPMSVVAWARFSQLKDMIRINGNLEQGLAREGLIREVGTGREVKFRHQGTWSSSGEIKAWALTVSGRAALRGDTRTKAQRIQSARDSILGSLAATQKPISPFGL
ncbi:hypothetical protein ACFQS3_02560 [Glycomyces mayteni]|uniref:Uncharacterized protein n=1 Tax=Glycomyces mayteni TaxID=543887 RepID=A0ABW2D1C2_9ACTN|nr:hypothetical protein GCM10025732_48110 [Glycomyces mayteni]